MTTETLNKWHVVADMYAEGCADVEICAYLGITQRTFDKQYEEVPAFAALIDKGRTMSKAWWYRNARRNVGNKDFNTSLFNFAMKNLHGWADKVDTTNTDVGSESVDKLRSEFNTLIARVAKENPDILRQLTEQVAATGT